MLAVKAVLAVVLVALGSPEGHSPVSTKPLPPKIEDFVSVEFGGSKAAVTNIGSQPILALCGLSSYLPEGGTIVKEAEWSSNMNVMFDPAMGLKPGRSHNIAPVPVWGRLDKFIPYESFAVTGIVLADLTSVGGELGRYCFDRFKGQVEIFRYYLIEIRMRLKRQPDLVRQQIKSQQPIVAGSFAEAFHKTLRYHIYDPERRDLKPNAAEIIDGLLRRMQ